MPLQEDDRKIFSLLEVTRSIQKTLGERYSSNFWVKAEMNKLNLHRQSGHCYPELVEKYDGKIIAQLKSILWQDAYLKCDKKFRKVLNEPLRDGIKILFLAKITFDSVYGLSLVIIDIDPSYTLGDLEREKQETIQKLIEEGIMNNNKNLPFPMLPQRIAIISVETSKGYADFDNVLSSNPYGFKFFTMVFPALLQGDRSVDSIIYQLRRVFKVAHHFDVVAIIRGGGGDVGLSSYNHYKLAKEIALFPIPVITGIGHATNETVSEMVSNFNAITPTKLAEHVLQYFHAFASPLLEAERIIHDGGMLILERARSSFNSEVKLFRSVSENMLLSSKHEVGRLSVTLANEARSIFQSNAYRIRQLSNSIYKDVVSTFSQGSTKIDNLKQRLVTSSKRMLKEEGMGLTHVEKNVANLSPVNVLKRGYSITLHNGHAVSTITALKPGDHLVTRVLDGVIESKIEGLENRTDE